MQITRNMESLQEAVAQQMRQGNRIGLVPTMGALHAGHMSLIALAQQEADTALVSIFVNPTQFGPNEDFDRYPRMLDADIEKAREAGAELIYAPAAADIYPPDFSTSITTGPLSTILCGKFRPGHFDGVATIVAKLLLRTLPHVAIFGEKDYQQLCVIRRMTVDLDIPVEIIGAPILREPDGLAMSSRNAYMTPPERQTAPKLYDLLTRTAAALQSGSPIQPLLQQGIAELTAAGFNVDYFELRDAENLNAMETLDTPARLLVAAWLGKTRLIDNIAVEPV
jgi:pantoate--beta-alanine ligase